MTKNQKIALGCGGAGCLGLIVIGIVVGVVVVLYRQPARVAREYNFNVNLNENSSNSNSNASTPDADANSNSSNSNENANSDSGPSTSVDSMSEDDKHKLFQAATMANDEELARRVRVKLGLVGEDYTPNEKYQTFMAEHVAWITRNYQFIQSVNTPEKARAYVNSHFPE